jgi:hypothetical protein
MVGRVESVCLLHFGAVYDHGTSIKMHRYVFVSENTRELRPERAFGTGPRDNKCGMFLPQAVFVPHSTFAIIFFRLIR